MSILGLSPADCATLLTTLHSTDSNADAARFAIAFFHDALPDEIAHASPDTLAEAALFAWRESAHRQPGQPLILLTPMATSPSGKPGARLLIVNDDMPFLVDSVSMELAARGVLLDRLLHPILDVRRTAEGQRLETLGERTATPPAPGILRESVIYLEIVGLPPQAYPDLIARLTRILADVRLCVADWQPMLSALRRVARDLKQSPPPIAPHDLEEASAFLEWMAADHFTLLGHRFYPLTQGSQGPTLAAEGGYGFGLWRDAAYPVWRGANGYSLVSTQLEEFYRTPEPLLITKSNVISTVHRHAHMDYIGIKAFDSQGRAVGDHRFVGLFTTSFYATSVRTAPLLRRKVAHVLELTGFDAKSHAGKGLVNVLDNFPRDEMIQTAPDRLADVALGLMSLVDRPRPRLFVRADRFERYVSILAYVPRDLYRADVRTRLGDALAAAVRGRQSLYQVELRDDGLARVHYVFGTVPGSLPPIDETAMNQLLCDIVLGWEDRLEAALAATLGHEQASQLLHAHSADFSAAYRAHVAPADAAEDLRQLLALTGPEARGVRVYRHKQDAPDQLRMKLYRQGAPIALSDCVPVIENFGLRVLEEFPFTLGTNSAQEFLLSGGTLDPAITLGTLADVLAPVLTGQAEDDAFNALTLSCGFSLAQVLWVRAYFRYLRQVGLPYGVATVRDALAQAPEVSRRLLDLFALRFDPNRPNRPATGTPDAAQDALKADIVEALRSVASLENDRILRAIRDVILATVRTNAYHLDPLPALAFKLRSADVPDLPAPRPLFEIFVYSQRVEGIHLRGGKVARGGLRWSDRRDDYRTEVLGLLKAQLVKNAVIVPTGAKGGFYPKQLPPVTDRDAWITEGQEAYKLYIRALLSLTDNRVGDAIVPPAHVVRHDEDDPYLVVAADKGTATFSNIANALSLEQGFWLGDAFASGGANGYDHKVMGITARGAWVAVQRHFRELGINTQTDPLRVIGVGDMSGDVFGNGLLQSPTVKLVAAFDHRHIFLDPDPDPASSFAERQRLYDLPRSSWANYDAALLSPGGGIFPRTQKSIPLTPQVRALLDIADENLDPASLLRAILAAPADLMWLGGIGCYVKAAAQNHADVGDKTNDAVRINAERLRVKVIGEGANLGITQEARVVFAKAGGHINTDFIDNSAGVDCSDNEVNLKILFGPLVTANALSLADRNTLLAAMTDDVAQLVLTNNYRQTQALSIAQSDSRERPAAWRALIERLEQDGLLDRALEGLPDEAALHERERTGTGLTRPEIAVLLSTVKNHLKAALIDSPVPDSALARQELLQAFPPAVAERFSASIDSHRLVRELVATKVANALVNYGGVTLVHDLYDQTRHSLPAIAAAFLAARSAFHFRPLWQRIDSYDYLIPAQVQTRLHALSARALARHMHGLLTTHKLLADQLDALVADCQPGIQALLAADLGTASMARLAARTDFLHQQGAPGDVAPLLSRIEWIEAGAALVATAQTLHRSPVEVAGAYAQTGDLLGLTPIAAALETLAAPNGWERWAIDSALADIEQARFSLLAQATRPDMPLSEALNQWATAHPETTERIRTLSARIIAQGTITVAHIGVLAARMRQISTDN